ncbi:uncharacterized protein LOC135106004 isoform X2 [Scylla paramamosain]
MLVLAWVTPLVLLCSVVTRAGAAGLGMGVLLHPSGGWEEDVAQAAIQVVQRYLTGCYLVLAAPSPSRALPHLIRRLSKVGELVMFLQPCGDAKLLHGNTKKKVFPGTDEVPYFWREVWGSSKATCRTFLLDLTTCGTDTADRVLSWTGLFLQPRTRVIVIGGEQDVEQLFQLSGLRNSLYVVYITRSLSTLNAGTKSTKDMLKTGGVRAMKAYHRCLYCTEQEAKPRLLLRWSLQDGIPDGFEMFGGQAELFMGRKMNIVSLSYYPYIKYKVVQKGSSTKLQFEDSLNTRMLTALAPKLNFTYILREPTDKLWGAAAGGGNWTGVVGTLQHEMADLSMDLTLTPGRAEVVEFSMAYIDESLVILSSKPKPLPEYLSVVRPLEGEVWGAIVVCVMVWGTVLWVMERLSHWISGRRYLSLTSSIFYGWGLLLEDHPFEPPPSPPSQMLVGWWLLVYLILSTAYRSSLISHLVVESKSSVVNSMEELAERGVTQGWVWGVPGAPMTGAFRPYFASSPNPAVLKVYEHIKIIEKEEGMMRVLEGNFAYIDNYYFIKTLVSTYYTDRTGYTPVHISTARYPLYGGNAWAFRKGAPFRARINDGIQRFLDAGLVALWMDEVIINHVKEERQALQERGDGPQLALVKASDEQVVLGLSHLQGTFYTLILGHTLASLSFFSEVVLRRR